MLKDGLGLPWAERVHGGPSQPTALHVRICKYFIVSHSWLYFKMAHFQAIAHPMAEHEQIGLRISRGNKIRGNLWHIIIIIILFLEIHIVSLIVSIVIRREGQKQYWKLW